MGTLSYAGTLDIKFEDNALAHLQIVMGAKLKRGEPFFFTWSTDPGFKTVWVHPTTPLLFTYFTNAKPEIDSEWLEALKASSDSTRGLQFSPAPKRDARPATP